MDEHRYIEEFGGTASYYELRNGIRDYYRTHYQLTPAAAANPHLNPGNGWVSRLCFEPRAGLAVLEAMLAPEEAAGRLRLLREHVPVAAELEGDRVTAVWVRGSDGRETCIRARYFLDATELGDLLPLTGAEHVVGSEAGSQTGEEHAPEVGNPEWAQSFTFPVAIEWCPGANHTIAKPEGYEQFRDSQPHTSLWTTVLPGRCATACSTPRPAASGRSGPTAGSLTGRTSTIRASPTTSR